MLARSLLAYRAARSKTLSIYGSTDGALSYYPMMVRVHYGSGTDLNEDVYLNRMCADDFSDIVFTDIGGAAIDFYRETPFFVADSAVFWVSVPLIPVSPGVAKIRIKCTGVLGASLSDGSAVFTHYFEDFTNTKTNLFPFGSDTGQSGGFDPVSRRLYVLGWENGSGNAYKAGQWVNVDTWETGVVHPGHPLQLINFSVVYHPTEELFYCYGGFDGYNNVASNVVCTYDPSTDTWATLTETLVVGVCGASAVYDPASGDVFILGGCKQILSSGNPYWDFSDTIQKHDISAGSIADTTANLADESWGHSGQMGANGYIYLFGGAKNDGANNPNSLDYIYKYDPSSENIDPSIVSGETLDTRKDTALTAVKGNDIYIFGGYDYNTATYTGVIERFNTSTDTLNSVTETMDEEDDDGCGYYDSTNGVIYVWPIQHSSKPNNDAYKVVIQEFDPTTESFITEPSLGAMPSGWANASSSTNTAPVAINESYMVLQDEESSKYLKADESITDLTGKQWVEFCGHVWAENGDPATQLSLIHI